MPIRELLPITRYWSPSNSLPSDEPSGASSDPLLYRLLFRPESRTLEEMIDAPYLFLLGEPALGKSTAIKQEIERLRGSLVGSTVVAAIDLAEVSSDAALDGEFQAPEIQAWIAGDSTLHLFLDGYDECLRHYPALGRRLLWNLRKLPLDRLRLRTACRSGDFPGSLVQNIIGIWPELQEQGSESSPLLRLEPLSESDIYSWAEAKGIENPAEFLAAVADRNAIVFAKRPLTLDALIAAFKQNEFPDDEVALYAFASRALCSDIIPATPGDSKVPTEGRLAVAERIAALMTLAGKDRLWLGPPSQKPSDAITVEEIAGGEELVGTSRITVDGAALREVISLCAVFEVHDAYLVRWSQQSYREFLAASYFWRRLDDKTKALQFFEHPGRSADTTRPIAPQLAETVAWLAAMNEAFAALIVEHDPIVFLRAWHYVFPSVRPKIAEWILQQTSAGRLINLDWSIERARSTVCHEGLGDELTGYLKDPNSNVELRTLATWLAGVCGHTDLVPTLLNIADDQTEALQARWAAAFSLELIGSEDDKASLCPLLEDVEGDTRSAHRLRAQLIRTLWPTHVDTSTMLDYLRRHQSSPSDEYRSALRNKFATLTEPRVTVEALAWMTSNAITEEDPLEWHYAEALLAAARTINNEEVRAALASVLVSRAASHQRFLPHKSQGLIDALKSQAQTLQASLVEAIAAEFATLGAHSSVPAYHLADLVNRLQLPYADIVAMASQAVPQNSLFWWKVLNTDQRTWKTASGNHPIAKALDSGDLDPTAAELFKTLIQGVEASERLPIE